MLVPWSSLPFRLLAASLSLFLVPAIAFAEDADDEVQPAPPVIVESRLAAAGQPLHAVVVAESATERTRAAAVKLAAYLSRISDAKFEIVTGDGQRGIAVGTTADFPALDVGEIRDVGDPLNREDYLLRSHEHGIYLLGATELAVEHAVWDLLGRLGYRQFFPGETWEVIPHERELSIAVNSHEHPSYYSRRIWYGYGPWNYAVQPYAEWCAKNRATSGIELKTGHAYDAIIGRHKAEFAAHPEYLGLVGGARKSSKFCISNAALRKLVIDDALEQFAHAPGLQSVSLDPSDGLGWCECDACQALGSISDRALTLANEVATAINADPPQNDGTPTRCVGMYAYSAHSPPPSIRVHPAVVVSVATSFIRGGYSADELLAGWQQQGATLGVREYYSVHTWDRDLPGKARGADVTYLATTIPHFHELGARFLSAEASDNWGPNGLGYYLAARLMWNVDEAYRFNDLAEDFLEKAFGPAQVTMRQFYHLLDASGRPLLSDDLIGRMYGLLATARAQADDPRIQRRLDELVLYTRYVELWSDYSNASGAERQAAFETLVRHAYRMRATMMVHAKALYRDVAARDKSVTIPAAAAWGIPEGKNPWKSSEPFSCEQLDKFTAEGIANRPLREFQTVDFSQRLVPASLLDLPHVVDGDLGLYSRGKRTLWTWSDEPSVELPLRVKGGIIYQDRGDVRLTLSPDYGAPIDTKPTTVPPDKDSHAAVLKFPGAGLHRVEVEDGGAGTHIAWPEGWPLAVCSSRDEPAEFHGRWSLFFYVPKGTKVVGGYSSGVGQLLDADGQTVHEFAGRPGYFRVDVPVEQDGRLWKFDRCSGQRLLMTVPPYLARNERELMLPIEVVARDANRPGAFWVAALRHPAPIMPELGAEVLARLGSQAQETVPALSEIVRQGDPANLIPAMYALRGIGPDAADAVPALTEALRNENFHVQYWACRALGSIGPAARAAEPDLVRLLENGTASARRNAALALGEFGSEVGDDAVAALVRALNDRAQSVRADAALALGKLGDAGRSATAALNDLAADPQRSARAAAATALWRLGEPRDVYLPVLLEELAGTHDPAAAAEALGIIGRENPEVIVDVMKLLRSETPGARQFAAEALGNIGPAAKAAESELRRLAESDPFDEIRESAAAALHDINNSQ